MIGQTPGPRWFVPPPPTALPPPPVDDFPDARVLSPTVEASARIVLRSLLMLSGLGVGALFLMYSSVHAADSQSAPATVAVGSTRSDGPPPATAGASPVAPAAEPLALEPIPVATETTGTLVAPDAGTVSGVYEQRRASGEVSRRIFVAPPSAIPVVRIEPNPVPAPDTNPYDEPRPL
jgi:hypothetical protein